MSGGQEAIHLTSCGGVVFLFFFIVMFCGTFDCNSHFEQTRLKLFLSLLSHYVLSEKKKLCKNCVV